MLKIKTDKQHQQHQSPTHDNSQCHTNFFSFGVRSISIITKFMDWFFWNFSEFTARTTIQFWVLVLWAYHANGHCVPNRLPVLSRLSDLIFNIFYLQILFTNVYVVVVYYLSAQPFELGRIFMFVLISVLTSLVAQSLGLLIGTAFSLEAGVFLGPVSTIPTILFCGFLIRYDEIPNYLRWLTYVSYVKFSFEGKIARPSPDHWQDDCFFYSPHN